MVAWCWPPDIYFFLFLCFLFHFSHQPTVMSLYWMGQFKLQREMSVLIKKWLHTYHFVPFWILRRYSSACRIINSFLLKFLKHYNFLNYTFIMSLSQSSCRSKTLIWTWIMWPTLKWRRLYITLCLVLV